MEGDPNPPHAMPRKWSRRQTLPFVQLLLAMLASLFAADTEHFGDFLEHVLSVDHRYGSQHEDIGCSFSDVVRIRSLLHEGEQWHIESLGQDTPASNAVALVSMTTEDRNAALQAMTPEDRDATLAISRWMPQWIGRVYVELMEHVPRSIRSGLRIQLHAMTDQLINAATRLRPLDAGTYATMMDSLERLERMRSPCDTDDLRPRVFSMLQAQITADILLKCNEHREDTLAGGWRAIYLADALWILRRNTCPQLHAMFDETASRLCATMFPALAPTDLGATVMQELDVRVPLLQVPALSRSRELLVCMLQDEHQHTPSNIHMLRLVCGVLRGDTDVRELTAWLLHYTGKRLKRRIQALSRDLPSNLLEAFPVEEMIQAASRSDLRSDGVPYSDYWRDLSRLVRSLDTQLLQARSRIEGYAQLAEIMRQMREYLLLEAFSGAIDTIGSTVAWALPSELQVYEQGMPPVHLQEYLRGLRQIRAAMGVPEPAGAEAESAEPAEGEEPPSKVPRTQ